MLHPLLGPLNVFKWVSWYCPVPPESVIPVAGSVLHVLFLVLGLFLFCFVVFGAVFPQYYNLVVRTITILFSNAVFNLVSIFHIVSLLSIKDVWKSPFIGRAIAKDVWFFSLTFSLS